MPSTVGLARRGDLEGEKRGKGHRSRSLRGSRGDGIGGTGLEQEGGNTTKTGKLPAAGAAGAAGTFFLIHKKNQTKK